MLAKKHRLTGADVQFILRKGKKIHATHLVFVVYPQYPNRPYNQLSIQIPLKVDKRSTMRNFLKRTAMGVGQEVVFGKATPIYCKIFVFINKQAIPHLQELIATNEKTTITKQRQRICREEFTSFVDHLGK